MPVDAADLTKILRANGVQKDSNVKTPMTTFLMEEYVDIVSHHK